jgi:DNA-binding response OmpR family regulator
MFGHPAISQTAGVLEKKLREGKTSAAEIDVLLTAVVDAIGEAMSGDVDVRPAQKSAEAVAKLRPTGKGRTCYQPLILVADDDPSVRGVLTEILSGIANIQCVASGREAVSAIAARRFDLVVLDYEMPDMNGFEVLATTKKHAELFETPIMMVSALRRSDQIVKLIAAGACNYVTKPFRPYDVLTRVRAILNATTPIVLIADDDPLVREILRHKLPRYGVRALTANSGVEALDTVRRLRPHLCILDRSMPRMDGLEVLSALRREVDIASTPVLMLSAHRTEGEIAEGFEMGADEYIVKPFLPNDVVQHSLRMLESRSQIAVAP